MEPKTKVIVRYFKLTVDGKDFTFNGAGHCEQVLRGMVHSGYEVTVKEVTELRFVTNEEIAQYNNEGVNFRHVDNFPVGNYAIFGGGNKVNFNHVDDSPKARALNEVCCEPTTPGTCR